MTQTQLLPPRDRLALSSPLVISGAQDRAVRRAAASGDLVTLGHGVHVAADAWREADDDERFRLRIAAARRVSRSEPVLSHAAAAFVWDLPWIGPWPSQVPATDPTRAFTRSAQLVRWHAAPLTIGDVVRCEGVLVTDPHRTSIDLALTLPFPEAVAIIDGCLNRGLSTHADLSARLDGRKSARRAMSARRALAFGHPGAASAGESLSRVAIAESGLCAPELQRAFHDHRGLIGYVDFWWAEAGVVGEFDGVKKYLRSEYRGGRSMEQVVLDEKRRSDRLLAAPGVRRLVRWGWKEARDPALLRALLASVGVTGRR